MCCASTPRLEDSIKIKVFRITPVNDGLLKKLDFWRKVTSDICLKTAHSGVTPKILLDCCRTSIWA